MNRAARRQKSKQRNHHDLTFSLAKARFAGDVARAEEGHRRLMRVYWFSLLALNEEFHFGKKSLNRYLAALDRVSNEYRQKIDAMSTSRIQKGLAQEEMDAKLQRRVEQIMRTEVKDLYYDHTKDVIARGEDNE